MTYVPGRFINAELDKASEDNERLALTLELHNGEKLGVVQIAGLVARRIVPFIKEGEPLGVGERFGLIRFGSRVDVYLPPGQNALVAIGQRTLAGETVLATDLAHDAYLRLVGSKSPWSHRRHFYGAASRLIRDMLVDETRRRQRDKRGKPDAAIRIGIRGGGCTGFAYLFEWDDNPPKEHDKVFEAYGAVVYVDPKSFVYFQGTELDFVRGMMGHGFKFNNPNVKGSCGCGESVQF